MSKRTFSEANPPPDPGLPPAVNLNDSEDLELQRALSLSQQEAEEAEFQRALALSVTPAIVPVRLHEASQERGVWRSQPVDNHPSNHPCDDPLISLGPTERKSRQRNSSQTLPLIRPLAFLSYRLNRIRRPLCQRRSPPRLLKSSPLLA